MVFCAVIVKITGCYYVIIYKCAYCVHFTSNVDDDCRKGDVMKRADIRKCFTEYVKAEHLQDGK